MQEIKALAKQLEAKTISLRRDFHKHAEVAWTEFRTSSIIADALIGSIIIVGMCALMAIPFATSIVLVMGSPEAEPAQPRALVGGHLVSTLVGILTSQLVGPAPWLAALAVGLAIIMSIFRTRHTASIDDANLLKY